MSIPTLDVDREAPTGRYYAYWTEGRRSKRKSMGTRDAGVAQERFAQWLLLRGQPPEGDDTTYTVTDCWTVYKAKHVDRKVAGPETLEFNWARLEPHFGSLLIQQINQDVVDDYVEKRCAGKIGRAVKPQTVRKELQTLFAAIRFCTVKPNQLFSSTIVEKVVLPEAGEPRERWLTMAEMKRMLDAAARLRRGDRLSRGERFLWLALEAPARMTAILELTWDRVHFDIGTIEFDVPGRKKTKKRRATVPMSKPLRGVLERAYRERINDYVMDNQADVWATVQLIAIEAGFGGERPAVLRSAKPKATGISAHTLRHSAATHMARNGVPLWKIAKILGNTLAMVEKVYAKWAPDDPAGTVDRISNGVLEAAE